jgi:hypothetical protein
MMRFYAILVLALALTLAGCVISPRRTLGGSGTGSGGGGTTPGGTGGQLYVTTPNSILRFSSAETVSGNTAPTATLTSTSFSNLQRLIVDTANDRLYVVSQGTKAILIFDNASTTLSGSVTPTRIIAGTNTGLTTPLDLALDTTNNILYVADGISVFLFANASTVNGNPSPASTIILGDNIGGLAFDVSNNLLYVSDPAGDTIDQLNNPNLQVGIAQPSAQIAGPDTKLSQPRGLVLDSSGRLLASNSLAPISITTYANASTATGDAIPFGSIAGTATLLQFPQQMAINSSVSNGELYVADPVAASILIFTNVSTTQGNLPPTRTIQGSSTGLALNAINGVALDTTR